MKRFIHSLVFLSLCLAVSAQDSDNDEIKTLFSKSNKEHSHGGYGAFNIGYSKIADRDAILLGGKGAWIIDHSFALGLAGYGIISDPKIDPKLFNNKEYEFAGGYGGVLLEPIILGKEAIHFSIPILIGAGGISYLTTWDTSLDKNNEYNYKEYHEDSDAYFVFEPGLELEVNMLKYFRFAIYGSYRYTSNINLTYQSNPADETKPNTIGQPICGNDILRGWNFGLVMKFGKF